MPVEGSFEKYLDRSKKDFKYLIKKTAQDGGESYLNTIKELTPVETGKLRSSTKKSRTKKTGILEYTVSIEAKTKYARYVEYGTAPHIIEPNKKEFLNIKKLGVTTKRVFHPGYEGAHMFQKGTAQFRDFKLEPIMRKNLAIFLAAGKKGLKASE